MGSSFIELSFIQVIAVSYSEAPFPGKAKLSTLITKAVQSALCFYYCSFSQPPPEFILQPVTLHIEILLNGFLFVCFTALGLCVFSRKKVISDLMTFMFGSLLHLLLAVFRKRKPVSLAQMQAVYTCLGGCSYKCLALYLVIWRFLRFLGTGSYSFMISYLQFCNL